MMLTPISMGATLEEEPTTLRTGMGDWDVRAEVFPEHRNSICSILIVFFLGSKRKRRNMVEKRKSVRRETWYVEWLSDTFCSWVRGLFPSQSLMFRT